MFSLARRRAKKPRDFEDGMRIIIACLEIIWKCQYKNRLHFWCLENPKGYLRWFLGLPAFTFDPYDFGGDYTKKTDLWGNFKLPIKYPIIPTRKKFDITLSKDIAPEFYGKLTRQERRAITPSGFAQAFFDCNR